MHPGTTHEYLQKQLTRGPCGSIAQRTAGPPAQSIAVTQGPGGRRHLAVVGDGLLVLLNDVLGAQAVLRPSNLRAGVGVDAVGSERTCIPRGRQEITFRFFRLVALLV